jgi:SAM-dependent methyltransferase
MPDARRHAPATARNREPIAAVLRAELPPSGLVLEVASGTGEHCAHFAPLFPALDWQPTDPDPLSLASIAAWGESAACPNIRPPLALDASAPDWPVAHADAMLCVNMVHISPWEVTLGLLDGAARMLAPGAPLILYGPYIREGVETAPSNRAFDADLRRRDPRWGLRAIEAMDAAAAERGLSRTALHDMPANNIMPVYRRRPLP